MNKFKRMAQKVNRSGVLFFALALPSILFAVWIVLKMADVIWPGCCG